MSIGLPDPPHVERFRQDFLHLAGEPGRIAVAVSGGPDSLALLLLAAAAWPGQVEAATVDHGLRPESRGEAEFVARLCRSLDVPHRMLSTAVDRHRSSLQRAAREARYAALAAWMRDRGISLIATAHHADDQAETLMMRLLRGSGVKGLSGVRPLGRVPGTDLRLVRPLLGWRRSNLAQIVEDAGVEAVQDPSNEDERFDRVRVRSHLRQSDWIDAIALSRSALALGEADEALGWAADRIATERLGTDDAGTVMLDPDGVPAELRRRLVIKALELVRGSPPDARGEEIGRLLRTLQQGGQANLAGILCRGGRQWTFRPEVSRRRG